MDSTLIHLGLEELAPPGIHGTFIIEPHHKNSPISSQEKFSDREKRKFVVKALLSKNPQSETTLNTTLSEENGTSFVKGQNGMSGYTLTTKSGRKIELRQNASNEFSLVHFVCEATSMEEAKRLFSEDAVPFIDFLSFTANCPIYISQHSCCDEKHGVTSIDYVSPHPVSIMQAHQSSLHKEMLPLFALFREAKNSVSNYYKFLCYYKILEGVYHHLRSQIFKEAKEKGITINRKKERLPEHGELRPSLTNCPIKTFFDGQLTEKRNEVAHFFLESGAILNLSDHISEAGFADLILPIELCCMEVMKTQNDYYNQVRVNPSG